MNVNRMMKEIGRSPKAKQAEQNVWINMYVIYKHPKEAPDKWVVRLWALFLPGGQLTVTPMEWIEDDQRSAQKRIPRAAEWFDGSSADDKEIAEYHVDFLLKPIPLEPEPDKRTLAWGRDEERMIALAPA